MHVCDPLLGNHWYGISGDDPDHGHPLDGNLTFHGSQNDRKRSMNLQDHEHYNYDYVDCNCHCLKPQSMRQPHNCIPKVQNNTVHKPFDLGDCSTRLCTVQFMNRYWLGTDIKTHLVFLSDGDTVKKFHFWNHILSSNEIIITECSGEALGFLQVSHTVQVLVNFCGDRESNPRLVHEEYVKDLHSRNRGFKSYPDYILHIIDKMIDQIDKNSVKETVNCQTVMCSAESTVIHHHNTPCNSWNQVDTLSDVVVRDFHDPGKTRGFMAHKSMEFQFIGPDRPPPTSTTLSDYINMATIIEATGVPNYKLARFPIHSGLNIDTWRHNLEDYHNKKLIENLTYGFPLSLQPDTRLTNTEVTNHYSARQFPADVQSYLDKEISLGAILGPFTKVPFEKFHCSPLLTRPKAMIKEESFWTFPSQKGCQ